MTDNLVFYHKAPTISELLAEVNHALQASGKLRVVSFGTPTPDGNKFYAVLARVAPQSL